MKTTFFFSSCAFIVSRSAHPLIFYYNSSTFLDPSLNSRPSLTPSPLFVRFLHAISTPGRYHPPYQHISSRLCNFARFMLLFKSHTGQRGGRTEQHFHIIPERQASTVLPGTFRQNKEVAESLYKGFNASSVSCAHVEERQLLAT